MESGQPKILFFRLDFNVVLVHHSLSSKSPKHHKKGKTMSLHKHKVPNLLRIKSNQIHIDITTEGDMMKVIPQVIVYTLNYISVDELDRLLKTLNNSEEFSVKEICEEFPFTKWIQFEATQNNDKFKIYSKNFRDKDIRLLAMLSLVLLGKENSTGLCNHVIFPLYRDKEFLALERDRRIEWIADVISEAMVRR